MFRRRRPLMHAAVVGGGAYIAGRSVCAAVSGTGTAGERAGRTSRQPGAASTGPCGPSSPGGACRGAVDARSAEPDRALHEQGALTDDEFAAAQARLLGG